MKSNDIRELIAATIVAIPVVAAGLGFLQLFYCLPF